MTTDPDETPADLPDVDLEAAELEPLEPPPAPVEPPLEPAEAIAPLEPPADLERFEPLARQAYAAYGESTGNKNYQGLPMPAWQDLPERVRTAWLCAAAAVARALLGRGLLERPSEPSEPLEPQELTG